jgi:anti-sigma B factor antagonist
MVSADLSIRDFSGNAVVALCGELHLADVPAVASYLMSAVAACGPSIIVDLADLKYIDASGLAGLVRVLKWTRGRGGELFLVAPRRQVRRVLKLTCLIDVFSVHPSVEHAASGARVPVR